MNDDVWMDQAVPQFSLKTTSGKTLATSDLQNTENRWTVFYFYPKDSTPGCTLESQNFRDLMPEFQKLNVQIFGISKDNLASHERFKFNECMPFELISDPDTLLCQALGVIQEKKNYGKTYLGIDRSTFLIDSSGVIKFIWRHVKVEGHAHAVLEKVHILSQNSVK